MYNTLPSPGHVLAFEITGEMTSADMGHYHADLKRLLDQHDAIGVYFDLQGLDDMAPAALWPGTQADLLLLGHLSQVRRYALVSDKHWPDMIVQSARMILPELEIRRFAAASRDEAIRWVSELPQDEALLSEPTPAIRLLPSDHDDVVAFEIDGMLHPDGLKPVLDHFSKTMASHEKVRVLNHMKHFGGVDLRVFAQRDLLSIKLKALTRVERYAVVGPPKWMQRMLQAASHLFSDMQIKVFEENQLDEAWVWVRE